ncbi:MAG TPA: hypothetical protein VNM92_02500 [Thermoanaerobaculia bacterium]|nr:hypothetical protein [Thermoanaerobaculia bacterium]
MNTDQCQKFLEDPEAESDHLSSCRHCAALADALGSSETGREAIPVIETGTFPVAPWEGAHHRSWSLVATAATAIAISAALFFLVSGISPMVGASRILESAWMPSSLPLQLARHLGSAVHGAPLSFHVTLACCFVVVNVLLAFLLKRAPKGINASTE